MREMFRHNKVQNPGMSSALGQPWHGRLAAAHCTHKLRCHSGGCLGLINSCIITEPLSRSSQSEAAHDTVIAVNTNRINSSRRPNRLLTLNESAEGWDFLESGTTHWWQTQPYPQLQNLLAGSIMLKVMSQLSQFPARARLGCLGDLSAAVCQVMLHTSATLKVRSPH